MAVRRDGTSRVLFHLVPANLPATHALNHPDNKLFVSQSEAGKGPLGLEIGFHVSRIPGRVLARLGRAGDLILPSRNVSQVHIAFEMHPDTHLLLLSVRAKQASSVVVTFGDETTSEKTDESQSPDQKAFEGDCVLVYGQTYTVDVVDYRFRVHWRDHNSHRLKLFAIRQYHEALQQQVYVRSRDLPTVNSSEVHTWHNTRIQTRKATIVREALGLPRVPIGKGSFGSVFKATDAQSGYDFAIKVIDLTQDANQSDQDVDYKRGAVHREVKALQNLQHKHIIELLGFAGFDTYLPEIYMPLRTGSLRHLADLTARDHGDELCTTVLRQILAALDYLASKSICHRDIKPENIVYYHDLSGRDLEATFQLVDFGLVNHSSQAMTICGSLCYMAPELHKGFGQSPKMDVWSLCATIAAINVDIRFPPTKMLSPAGFPMALRVAMRSTPRLGPMLEENPEDRASAAQLLVEWFQGEGLTTPRNKISAWTAPRAHALEPDPALMQTAQRPQAPVPGPSKPLIIYPRTTQHQQLRWKGKSKDNSPWKPLRPIAAGITKSRPATHRPRMNMPGMQTSPIVVSQLTADGQDQTQAANGHSRMPGGFPD